MHIFVSLVISWVAGCASSFEAPGVTTQSQIVSIRMTSPKSTSELENEAPVLFRQKAFNSSTLTDAANHYIKLGEEATIREFKALSQSKPEFSKGIDVNERIGWMCRILFVPKKDSIRQPFFGGLSLPFRTMPAEKWPLYPIAKSGITYCVLSEGYMLAGQAEPVMDYVSYCRNHGTFRTVALKSPSRKVAIKDLEDLHNSSRWKAIKWQGKGPGYSFFISEKWTWDKISKQASSIPTGK